MEKKTEIHSLQAIRTDSRDKHINIINISLIYDDYYYLLVQ